MKDIKTDELNNILNKITTKKEHEKYKEEVQKSKPPLYFYNFFNEYISTNNLDIANIIKNSGLSKDYAYQIINGRKKNPSRDKIICLCIGAKMNLDMINRALKIAKYSPLYAKDVRDIEIIYSVNKKTYDILSINFSLSELDLAPLE